MKIKYTFEDIGNFTLTSEYDGLLDDGTCDGEKFFSEQHMIVHWGVMSVLQAHDILMHFGPNKTVYDCYHRINECLWSGTYDIDDIGVFSLGTTVREAMDLLQSFIYELSMWLCHVDTGYVIDVQKSIDEPEQVIEVLVQMW